MLPVHRMRAVRGLTIVSCYSNDRDRPHRRGIIIIPCCVLLVASDGREDRARPWCLVSTRVHAVPSISSAVLAGRTVVTNTHKDTQSTRKEASRRQSRG